MSFAAYTPILLLPAAVVVGRPALAFVSLENFVSVRFTSLTVSISGEGVRKTRIAKTPDNLQREGRTARIPLEIVAVAPGEHEIAIRVSLTCPTPGQDTAITEEWLTEPPRAPTLSAVADIGESRTEELVIAELARIPGLATAKAERTLGAALDHIRQDCSWPVRLPRFHSTSPQRPPVRTPSAEPRPPEPAVQWQAGPNLPPVEKSAGEQPPAPVKTPAQQQSLPVQEPVRTLPRPPEHFQDKHKEAPPRPSRKTVALQPPQNKPARVFPPLKDISRSKHWKAVVSLVLIVCVAGPMLLSQKATPSKVVPAPTPAPTPQPAEHKDEPETAPQAPAPTPSNPALDYLKMGIFLDPTVEGRKERDQSLLASIGKHGNLKNRVINVLFLGESLRSAVAAGEVDKAVLLGAETRKTMDAIYEVEPAWQPSRMESERRFHRYLCALLQVGFSANGANFVHNAPSRAGSAALKTALTALEKLKTTHLQGDLLSYQCRKAWANGAFAAIAASSTTSKTPEDIERLQAILKVLPMEFVEARESIEQFIEILAAKNSLSRTYGRMAVLQKIIADLFTGQRDIAASPGERMISIKVLLSETKDIEDWREILTRIVNYQSQLDTRNYVGAMDIYEEIKGYSLPPALQEELLAQDILKDVKQKVSDEMLLAVGPVILKANFPTEEDALPLPPSTKNATLHLKRIQTMLQKLAQQEKYTLTQRMPEGEYGIATQNAILSAQKVCFPKEPSRWNGKITTEFASELTKRTVDK